MRRAGVAVEERRHRIAVDRCVRAERAVRPAGRDAAGLHPLNLLVEGMGGRHIREAGRARGGELRRACHAVEERRHRAALNGLQRAVGAVRVAGGDATLSQPRNLGVELVAALHVGEAGRGDVLVLLLLDVQHLGAVAGCAVHAREVAGAVVQVQQQCLCGGAGLAERGEGVGGAVRLKGATGGVREEACHGGGVAAEP